MHVPRFVVAFAPGLALGAGLLLAPSSVRAEAEGVVFRWSRDASAGLCAPAEAMSDEIGRRLGTAPFSTTGRRSLEGFVERRDGAYRVRLALRDAEGQVAWTRELTSSDADCTAATQAAALAVVALLAPEVEAARQSARDAQVGEDADASAVDASPRDGADGGARVHAAAPLRCETCEPARPAGAAAASTLEVLAVTSAGVLPVVSFGVDVGATRLLQAPFRLELGATWLGEVRTDDERFGFGLVAARVGLCGERASTRLALGVCGRVHAGVVHGTVYEISPSRPGERAWLGLSAGPVLRVHLVGPLVLSGGASLVVNALRYQFVNVVGANDSVVFEQPVLGFQAQLGLGLAFP